VTLQRLYRKEIQDPYARENFNRLESYARDLPLGKGLFKFLTATLTAKTYPATVSFAHTLGFVPKDVIQTSVIGPGTLVWEYADFTRDEVFATISDSVTFRAFFGSYSEGRTS
jgi:hypothetical protein